MVQPCWEKGLTVSYKVYIHLSYAPATPLHSPTRRDSVYPQKDLYTNIHHSFIHSPLPPNLRITHMSINRGMQKHNVVET